jgi:sulfoxide reductase heme-binding subunit YedZ
VAGSEAGQGQTRPKPQAHTKAQTGAQSRIRRLLNSSLLAWVLLAAPGAWLLQAYAREIVFYGEALHRSGIWALWLLIATLALTPLGRLLPGARWLRWLRLRRRWLGVASFGYGALHAVIYLQRRSDLQRISSEALEPGMATGWLALLIFGALAATSNDTSVRRLGGRDWKRLHRSVYAAAALTLAHWILTAFDPTEAWAYAAGLALLLGLRFLPTRTVGR